MISERILKGGGSRGEYLILASGVEFLNLEHGLVESQVLFSVRFRRVGF